jgi:hypothetical protein
MTILGFHFSLRRCQQSDGCGRRFLTSEHWRLLTDAGSERNVKEAPLTWLSKKIFEAQQLNAPAAYKNEVISETRTLSD